MGGLIDIPFVKQPWEQRVIRFNWAEDCQPLIDNGYAFSAIEVKVFDVNGADLTDSMVQGIPYRTGNYIYATIKDGTNGVDYYCRIRVTLIKTGYDDEKIEADLLIQVIEKGK